MKKSGNIVSYNDMIVIRNGIARRLLLKYDYDGLERLNMMKQNEFKVVNIEPKFHYESFVGYNISVDMGGEKVSQVFTPRWLVSLPRNVMLGDNKNLRLRLVESKTNYTIVGEVFKKN